MQGDVAHMVDRFDAPVVPASGLELRRIHFVMGTTGQHNFGFLGDVNRFEVMGRAHNERGLRGVGEAG